MPLVNIYFKRPDEHLKFQHTVGELRKFLSNKLSGSSRRLSPGEITIRLINPVNGKGMIGDVELDISAHVYPERVERQDEICKEIQEFLGDKGYKTKVWLKLSELGHGF